MKSNLLFVTAQPDVPYFHWQSLIYVNNFIEKGINPKQIHVIFGIVDGNKKPHENSLKLLELGVNVHYFVDDRENKKYIPSIKPYLISKWIKQNPKYGKLFFLHDADIIFRELPDFDRLINDDIIYVSDTVGYIGYNYIMDCCKRYEERYPKSRKGQLMEEMANVIGVSVECVRCNQENSGGGQYIIKDTDYHVWEKIYNDCVPLYNQMLSYQKRFPVNPGEIQFWTAEMWSLLWNLWYFDKETKITKDLDFSWATDSIEIYEKKPILHMAGVTESMRESKFYKGDFISADPILKLIENPNYFNYVDKNSATIKYVEVMKSITIKNK
jgi:hypothetical protein